MKYDENRILFYHLNKQKFKKSNEMNFNTNKEKGNLRSYGGTKGVTYKTVVDTNVDYLFILNQDKDMYFIPKNEITNRNTLNLCQKYKKYKVV